MSIFDEKQKLRKEYRKKRRSLPADFIAAASLEIENRLFSLDSFNNAKKIFIYVATFGEVETRKIIEKLFARGKTVVVPRVAERGKMDLVQIASFADLAAGAMGIMEPRGELLRLSSIDIDFAVIPALALGLDGSRLGQGGGYYDRFLQNYKNPFCALCFEDFLCPSLPTEETDIKVPAIITESRIITP